MAVYGYYITGSDDTKDSISAKRKKIRAYALLNDCEIEHIFTERDLHQNKPLNKRPKGKKLLNLLNTKDVVITVKLSDVFYCAQNTLSTIQQFDEQNIELHVVEIRGRLIDKNMDKSLLLLLKQFTDFEFNLKQEKKFKAENNESRRRGKTPFGFTLQDGELIKNPEEQSVISDMNEMYKNGMGYLAIAKEIDQKHKFKFSHMGVKKILQRK